MDNQTPLHHPSHERLTSATLTKPPMLALVIKRTYDITPNGSCRLAEKQYPVHNDVVMYDELDPPQVSAPQWDNDLFALKTLTDVILQGSAHTYGGPVQETTVELNFAHVRRAIKVYGDRRVEWGADGEPRFTPPVKFEEMPLCYDRAYGGQDAIALKRQGDPVEEVFDFVRPEWLFSTTSPYHYPRNPAGTGYVIETDRESIEGIRVPNLEWQGDPLTPKRLGVGTVDAWMGGALPACFDWHEQSWFPRMAYLGEIPEHTIPPNGVPEVVLGLAASDLMEERSILDQQIHPLFVQGASPGLAVKDLKPDEIFTLVNLCPDAPYKKIQLPGEIPSAVVQLPMRGECILKPFLSTVVIQPDDGKVVLVWSCRSEVQRPYGQPEFININYRVTWETDRRGKP